MKSIRSLFIALVGMASLTMTATTATPSEQKQKATFEQPEMVYLKVVNVVSYEYVSLDAILISGNTLIFSEPKIFKSPLAIITDVGWKFRKQYSKEVPFREKLLENYNLQFKMKLLFSDHSPRSNC